MILTISDMLKLKEALQEKFHLYLHFHDGCGGQYFSFDTPIDPMVEAFIQGYFSEQNCTIEFDEDKKGFFLH